MRFALALLLAAAPTSADRWSGLLIDSRCYASEERNVNPFDASPYVDRDKDWEIRFCAPTPKTKHFAIVESDWSVLQFDSAGNAKAAELVLKTGKKKYLPVTVKGTLSKDKIKVDSVSVSR